VAGARSAHLARQERAPLTAAAERSTPSLRFGGIEAARGVAAVLVAAYHGARLVAQPRYSGVVPAGGLLADFAAGVDFFFVLSGFLITWVHWFDIGRPARLGHYFSRRFTRIYPTYWAVLFPTIIGRLLHFGSTAVVAPSIGLILCSIFLVPNVEQPVLGVGWTLVYEIFFYCMFGLAMIAGKRAATIIALVWAGLIVFYSIAASPSFPTSFFLSPVDLEFLLGVAIASLLRGVRIPYSRAVAIFGAVFFIALMLIRPERFTHDQIVIRLGFGFGAALFVMGTVEAERTHGQRVPGWLALLGAASYSIYLVHSLIEPGVMIAIWPLLKRTPPLVITILLTCAGTAAGIIFHKLVEKPLLARVRRAFA
jgi:exopolysaccharide production protein ExoZ